MSRRLRAECDGHGYGGVLFVRTVAACCKHTRQVNASLSVLTKELSLSQRPAVSVVPVMNGVEIEVILWSALPTECAVAGPEAVSAIAMAIAYDRTSDVELVDAEARDAALELITSAAFIKDIFAASAVFSLREARPPSTQELVFEAAKNGPVVRAAFPLARAFLAQRIAA